MNYSPHFFGKMEYSEEECKWAFDFIVNLIIELQLQGYELDFNERTEYACAKTFADDFQMQITAS